MSMRRFAAFVASLLLLTVLANAVARNNTIRIKVLDSETHSVNIGDGVPKNCDGVNFDAYCHNSNSVQITHTLLVQEENGTPFRVACDVNTKWSRCTLLPRGESFEARKEKKGITVYYIDDAGKARSQLYVLVAAEANANPAAGATAAPTQLAPVAAEKTVPAVAAASVVKPETVKCSFSSTPSGADVTLDGRYVGSTPSVVGLTTGNHVVVISTTGFAQWKRELTVTPGSELTVNAVLQKAQ